MTIQEKIRALWQTWNYLQEIKQPKLADMVETVAEYLRESY